jgi:hypothetical protein
MATPTYAGQGQPTAASGGWLSRLFGSTPSYAGVAPAAPRTSLFSIAPTYKSAATTSDDNATTVATPTQFAIVIPRQVVEPQT